MLYNCLTRLVTCAFLMATTVGCGAVHNNPSATPLAAMSLIDLAQSVEMQKIGSPEINPSLSENPSIGEMAALGAVGIGVVYLTDKYMAPSRFKTVLLDSILESEKANIESNRNVLRYGKRTVSNTTMIIICFRH